MKKKKYFDPNDRKYRKSIVEAMTEDKIKKYGFEKSYIIFEKSINRLAKEGDKAEELAYNYLKENELLGDNHSLNRVITLGRIKIEADIIDYDRKIIYETKSRKTGKLAKQAIKRKWRTFEYDKPQSIYEDYKFCGIIVANYNSGQKIKGIIDFEGETLKSEKVKKEFDDYFTLLEQYKKIEKE